MSGAKTVNGKAQHCRRLRASRGGVGVVVAGLASALALAIGGCGEGTTQYPAVDAQTSAAADSQAVAPASVVASGSSLPGTADGSATSSGGSSPVTSIPATGANQPISLLLLQDDPSLLHELPQLVHTETLADSGLQVGYTTGRQRDLIDPLYVEAQWQHMQTCTGITAVPPLVVITEGPVDPFTPDDDVVRNIDGSGNASASVGLANPVIQVRESDFDGTLGSPGFNLRAILGRHLWLRSDLPERDYPFRCAREEG